MWSPLGDPDAIEALAGVFDRRAHHLGEIGHRVKHRADTASWACAKADRFRHQMAERQRRAEQLAGELRNLANELRRIAARVRAQIEMIAGLERQARAVISAFRPAAGILPPWVGTGWDPSRLPSPGDPAWQGIARTLGIR